MGDLGGCGLHRWRRQHSARLPHDACRGLGFLGLVVDHDANGRSCRDRVVSAAGAPGAVVVVVAARDDLEIAVLVTSVLGGSGTGP